MKSLSDNDQENRANLSPDLRNISLSDFAGFISSVLRQRNIEAILVGGACVTIYSRNRYQSSDLDFVTYHPLKAISEVLLDLGFERKNRYFIRRDCPWFLDFVSPPVAIGREPITAFHEKKSPLGTIRMLRPEDSGKDRLASYFYWNDREGLDQAVDICLECNVDLEEVGSWSKREGFPDEFMEFTALLDQTTATSS